jgi:hypothetical protein
MTDSKQAERKGQGRLTVFIWVPFALLGQFGRLGCGFMQELEVLSDKVLQHFFGFGRQDRVPPNFDRNFRPAEDMLLF